MRAIAVGLLLSVAACRQEPGFDERYSETENRIAERANALDTDLNSSSETFQARTVRQGSKR
jgi:hypothetical protein